MSEHLPEWTNGRKLLLGASACFILLGITFSLPMLADRREPSLRISAGPEGTRRHRVAEYLREQAATNGLDLRLSPSAGSEDCLEQLKAGKLDAAIVSNGVVVPAHDGIRVLGAMQVEAVHILLRKELAESGKPLAEVLHGRTVNLGEKGSTEAIMTREALAFARMKLPTASEAGDIVPTEHGKTFLANLARQIQKASGPEKEGLIAELPDCLMILATLPSTIVQQLMEAADYRVLPMPGARAFLMDNLLDTHVDRTVLDREFLETTKIPTNSYFAGRGYPLVDCDTIGVRLVVVARQDAPTKEIKLLMHSMFDGEFTRRIQPKSPREVPTPFAIHPAATAYLDKDKPLAIRETMESVTKGFSVFGAFSAGALTLYGFLRKKKPRKPSDYFASIRQVDMIARGVEADEAAPIHPKEFVQYLDDRLLGLRQDLIEDICNGRIKGDQVIANILALLKDTRANLQRIREAKLAELTEPAKPRLHVERRSA